MGRPIAVRLLLDTCTFLWIAAGSDELSPHARACFVDPDNEVYLSAVSAWEIAVKHALDRLPLPEPPTRFVPAERERHGIDVLPLDEESALHLDRLPRLHRDPFDRMLVCQALVHGLTILSPDPLLSQYPVRTTW
jgi:PIN domain nuclease of toxin-antitoxin system